MVVKEFIPTLDTLNIGALSIENAFHAIYPYIRKD
jgi:hypothetical protein